MQSLNSGSTFINGKEKNYLALAHITISKEKIPYSQKHNYENHQLECQRSPGSSQKRIC